MAQHPHPHARTYVRDARGRFAPVPGHHKSSSKGRSTGGKRGRSSSERLALAGADVAAARLKHSEDPRARALGLAVSVAGSVYRNPQVQTALRKRAGKRS